MRPPDPFVHFVRFVPFELEETNQSIVARFGAVVRAHADRIAIGDDREDVDYRELDRRSNRVANSILGAIGRAGAIGAGGGPVPLVALCLDQGVLAITAILGVLKAGCSWAPLDPGRPAMGNREVLRDSGACLILTAGESVPSLSAAGAAPAVLDVDQLDEHASVDAPDIDIDPDQMAYIFYTSGSTGEPKGVFDSHRNLLHNVMRYTNSLRIESGDRLTLIQSCSFSGTLSSLFGALLNGACVLPFDLRSGTPSEMADWLERRRATIYHSVPSLFRSVFAGGRQSFDSLRVVRLEGDTASGRDVALRRDRLPASCALVNGLGTTETGLVTQYFVPPDEPIDGRVLPVGFPVDGVKVRVVDEAGAPLPIGEVGEIAVQGRHLAGGYWGRPDLTAERFAHSGDGSEGERIYRTGDLGRLRADGCLEHLGRTDSRVKIRGQAVELAEVESAVQALDAVDEAAVVAHEDESGEVILVAYLVVEPGSCPSVSDLRRNLTDRLPDAMIPTRRVIVESLPVSSSGKLERRMLPALQRDVARPAAARRPPGNLVELRVAELWEEILAVDSLCPTDDFFDLGGHSLRAVALMDRIEEVFAVRLPASTLLRSPTIAGLAHAIARDVPVDPLISLGGGDAEAPFFYLHGDHLSGGLYCRALMRSWSPREVLHRRHCSGRRQ